MHFPDNILHCLLFLQRDFFFVFLLGPFLSKVLFVRDPVGMEDLEKIYNYNDCRV